MLACLDPDKGPGTHILPAPDRLSPPYFPRNSVPTVFLYPDAGPEWGREVRSLRWVIPCSREWKPDEMGMPSARHIPQSVVTWYIMGYTMVVEGGSWKEYLDPVWEKWQPPTPAPTRWREQGQDKDKALLFSLFFTSSIFQDPNPLFTAEMKLQSVSVFLA